MSTKPNIAIKKRGDKLTAAELNDIVDYFTRKMEEDNLPEVSDGKSAYELAVELGYTGTKEEWLDSLSPMRYFDGNVFEGNGTSEAEKLTVKNGFFINYLQSLPGYEVGKVLSSTADGFEWISL